MPGFIEPQSHGGTEIHGVLIEASVLPFVSVPLWFKKWMLLVFSFLILQVESLVIKREE